MTDRNIWELRRPSGWFGALWKEALPLGDGRTGALVYGGVQTETVTLTRHDLWHWGGDGELPDVSWTLAESRRAIDAGDWARANGLLSGALRDNGYSADPAAPFPLADLVITSEHEGMFSRYRRSLDMSEAEARVSFLHGQLAVKRRCFVSRETGMLLLDAETDAPCEGYRVALRLHRDGTPNTERMLGEQRGFLIERAESDGQDGWLFWRGRNGEDGDYGAVARVVSDGRMAEHGGELSVKNASRILVLLLTFAGEPYEAAFARCRAALAAAEPDYEAHKRRHLPLHRALFDSCSLRLEDGGEDESGETLLLRAYDGQCPAGLMETLWRFGRYLFLCGTAEGGSPFPLYGLWNGEYFPVWSQNVANENVAILYWHVHTGGLDALVRPLIDYYCAMTPKMRENAQRLFGCRGIFLSTYTTPKNAYVTPVVPVITNWIGGAGWMCQHFFRYYRQTGDRRLFREKILPFMTEAARFYCDYAVRQEDGTLRIYPSVSPENSPANFIPERGVVHLGHAMPAVVNATMDFAILKELLTNLLSVADEYPELCADAPEWRRTLAAIPPYQVNGDGAVKEWMDPELRDFYCHRHLSHLYPVFPGSEVTPADGPLWKAFERAVDLRELGGQVGWSLMHMASLYARFGRGEDAAACFDLLIKGAALPNLMMLSNDYRSMGVTMDVGQFAPIQLDANLGAVNAVQEMLFHDGGETLSLLPACPARLARGSAREFRFAGGRISFSWDLEKGRCEASVLFERAGSWRLEPPHGFGGAVLLEARAGETRSLTFLSYPASPEGESK